MNGREPSASTGTDLEPSEWPWARAFVVASGLFLIGMALLDGRLGGQGTWTDAVRGGALGAFLLCGGIAQAVSEGRWILRRVLWAGAFLFGGIALAVALLF